MTIYITGNSARYPEGPDYLRSRSQVVVVDDEVVSSRTEKLYA